MKNIFELATLASLSLVHVGGISSNCLGTNMSVDWYYDLIFVGINAGNAALNSTGLAIAQGEIVDGPLIDANLGALLAVPNDPCSMCALDFANDLRLLQNDTDFLSACGNSSIAWDSSKLQGLDCLDELYESVSTFNSCTDNGYDIVTAEPTVRCSTDEFVDIDADFRPWGPLVLASMSDLSDSDDYAANISAAFATNLEALTCSSCFDTLYDDLVLLNLDTACQPSPYAAACLAATADARIAFGVCTGGHELNTDIPSQCDAAEATLFDSVYRPYSAYVHCAGTGLLYDCVHPINGIEDSPASPCDSCFGTLQAGIVNANDSSCLSNPYSDACTSVLNAKDGPLREFHVCTGFSMNFNSTLCVSAESVANITSIAPMLIAVSDTTDIFAAGNLIFTSSDLGGLNSTTWNLNCESCFRAFMADVVEIGGLTPECAANPYTSDCLTSIELATDRFTACSGIVLTADSDSTCSSAEFTAILDVVGLTDQLFAIGLAGDFNLTAVVAANSALEVPCKFCFEQFVLAVAQLCDSGCSIDDAVLVGPLAVFESCSGFAFALTATTSPAPTTAVTTTTTVTTTVAATTSTASIPLSKSAAAATLSVALWLLVLA